MQKVKLLKTKKLIFLSSTAPYVLSTRGSSFSKMDVILVP